MIQVAKFYVNEGSKYLNEFLKELEEKGHEFIDIKYFADEGCAFANVIYNKVEAPTSTVNHEAIKKLVYQLEVEEILFQAHGDIIDDETDILRVLTNIVCTEYKKLFTEEEKQKLEEYKIKCEEEAKKLYPRREKGCIF